MRTVGPIESMRDLLVLPLRTLALSKAKGSNCGVNTPTSGRGTHFCTNCTVQWTSVLSLLQQLLQGLAVRQPVGSSKIRLVVWQLISVKGWIFPRMCLPGLAMLGTSKSSNLSK